MYSQIAFSNRHNFAFVSFLPVRKAKERPKVYIVVTFGLGYRVKSPRIDAAAEPYSGRFTHHVLVSGIGEIDEELMDWVKKAAFFRLISVKYAAGKIQGWRAWILWKVKKYTGWIFQKYISCL